MELYLQFELEYVLAVLWDVGTMLTMKMSFQPKTCLEYAELIYRSVDYRNVF